MKPANEKPVPSIRHSPEEDDSPVQNDGLTIRQRLFVEALIGPARGNATKAAALAGYRDDNRVALAMTASENLRKPYIQEAIAHGLARLKCTPQWVQASLVDLASSSMANFLSVDTDGKPSLDFGKAAAAGAIGQIREYREEGFTSDKDSDGPVIVKRSIKLHDRVTALGLLMKMFGLLSEDIAVSAMPAPMDLSRLTDDELATLKRIRLKLTALPSIATAGAAATE